MKEFIDLDDTIVAISTPVGEGGIGIIRMSGEDSLSIADKIFKSRDGRKPSQFETYTTHYGHIIDPSVIASQPAGGRRTCNDKGAVDEVILTIMHAPRTYTKEDVVEINCHGGIVPLKKVLELVVSLGARLAEPGEFTKRAFLNGRIDLAQAEAVLDVIRAKTERGLKAAINQLEGGLSSQVGELRQRLLNLYTHIEASLDFPEDELEILSDSGMLANLKDIIKTLKALIDTADNGRV